MPNPVAPISAVDQHILEQLQTAAERGPLSAAQLAEVAQHNGVGVTAVRELYDRLRAEPGPGAPGAGRANRVPELMAAADNPFVGAVGLPPFDDIRVDQIEPGMAETLERAEAALAELERDAVPTWNGVVEPLVRLTHAVYHPWGWVGHLLSVKNSDELRAAHKAVQPRVVDFGIKLSQSRPLYDTLVALRDGAGSRDLDATQQRIVHRMIQEAELSGVGLDGDAHARFKAIELRLAEIGTRFGDNVLDATKSFAMVLTDPAEVAGLPASYLAQAAAAAADHGHQGETAERGPWRITLAAPSYIGFMKHARRRDLREQLYRAYVTRASSGELDNTSIIREILTLRREKAQLLGYDNYAEVSLAMKMAPDVGAVEALLEKLRDAAFGPARRELEELRAFARAHGETAELMNWDTSYWAERVRETKLALVEDEIREYLPFERVVEGLFALVKHLFGVEIKASPMATWHDDVRTFEVSRGGRRLARFFLDPFARPAEKRGGAWMNSAVGRSRLITEPGRDLSLPAAYIVCNGTPPANGKPATMTFAEMETLFHEMGHALQHMLTAVDYDFAAGIENVEWDAVELPSQFLENFCYHPDTLKALTRHVDTGEPMPDELIDKIVDGKNFLAGIGMLRQINFGMTDMALHTTYDPAGERSPFELHREISETTSVLPPLPEDRFLNAFSHVFKGGYAAGYYSYKWAEVLSADAFSAFEDAGLEDPVAVAATGRHFLDTVLALGGSRPAAEVFRAFRGRDPDPTALLRHSGLAPSTADASA